jgi:predicted nucleotidyltransferase component of viral defense system
VIARGHVTAWRRVAPWPSDAQVEQDLALSRALVGIYSSAVVAEQLAFRGGTALHKLLLPEPGRYSEDIDLVQLRPGPIGPALDAVRDAMDGWLGTPSRKQTSDGVTLIYRFESSSLPTQPMRIKIEINTREHGSHLPVRSCDYSVSNPWFSGSASVRTYAIEEILGTKLRALYQRKKGRDLFDLWLALTQLDVVKEDVISSFGRSLQISGERVTRAQFERNLLRKAQQPEFLRDVMPLLREGNGFEPFAAVAMVREELLARMHESRSAAQRRRRRQ